MPAAGGADILFDGWWANIAWTFNLRQYYFQRNGVEIAPQSGECVIDAGACFGDTALAFADSVGESGHVHAFEVLPANLEIAEHNLKLNSRLAGRVTLNRTALGRGAGSLFLHGTGPGAYVSERVSAQPAEMVSIDGYVEKSQLGQIDFIKMDIEGSELDALEGARETLKKFRPKLAISIYHRPTDLIEIPLWVDRLDLGYRCYIDHYTIHYEESVLYAIAD